MEHTMERNIFHIRGPCVCCSHFSMIDARHGIAKLLPRSCTFVRWNPFIASRFVILQLAEILYTILKFKAHDSNKVKRPSFVRHYMY